MNNRQSFHLYKIFENYSKEFISFSYSPKYKLFKSYYLSYKNVEEILNENDQLINAFYSNNIPIIDKIINQKDIDVNEFEIGQNEENNYPNIEKVTPLPIQARYVLKGWNALRINANKIERNNLINTLNKKAFNTSFFPQITKMALAYENNTFFKYSLDAYNCASQNNQLLLFYRVLSYYFRINNKDELKEICNSLIESYKNHTYIDSTKRDVILSHLNKNAT